jgi:hypothetical protein
MPNYRAQQHLDLLPGPANRDGTLRFEPETTEAAKQLLKQLLLQCASRKGTDDGQDHGGPP